MVPPPFPTIPSAPGTEGDPLQRFRDCLVAERDGPPIPLVATRIKVLLAGGLAVVRTERVFRNAEAGSIEATLTFPVPVHATLFGLVARIDGRLLRATAQRRDDARAAYEAAVDRGKTAVLHEEALRGVHVLSLAHLPPGAEVTVASDWTMPLAAAADGAATLRIPTTVGQVFGRTPLADSDDLVTDAAVVHAAELEVHCAEGSVAWLGGDLVDGRAHLRLDRPIDLRVAGWTAGPLQGVTAEGRGIALRIAPDLTGDAAVDAVVLVDRSGSMSSPAGGGGTTKHAAVVAGLRAAAAALRPGDRVRLWEFDSSANPVRSGRRSDFLSAIDALGPPRGGTETGAAITAVLAAEAARDVVLVTDGQSWELDVQAAMRSGRRFTVVLIGADSLEANVGRLAALSGGQLFVAGVDTEHAVRLALAALRQPHQPAESVETRPDKVTALIGGMCVTVTLGAPAPAAEADALLPRAVAAIAAALVLPRLPEPAAAALAEAEGLCCHLTSLVLVDEAGAAQAGLPAQRKVALMAPSVAMCGAVPAPMPPSGAVRTLFRKGSVVSMHSMAPNPNDSAWLPTQDDAHLEIPAFLRRQAPPGAAGAATGAAPPLGSLAFAQRRVAWSRNPEALRHGELDGLPPDIAAALRQAGGTALVVELARILGQPPLAVAVALLAGSDAVGNRAAARVSRAVLGRNIPHLVAEARRSLGL